MNKFNTFVRNNNGVMKLPPGFRFQPTDEELVFEYLRRKIYSCPLPSSSDIIPDINLCKYDPWDLPFSGDDMEQDRYFFSNKEAKYRNGSNRANRKTSSGYWKATGSDKKIVSSTMKHVVGTRKTLVFYKGKECRTSWFMYEYSLHVNNNNNVETKTTNFSTQQDSQMNQTENWVLCRIFLKERNTNDNNSKNYYHNEDENIEQNWEDNNINNSNNNNVLGTSYEPMMFNMGHGINFGPTMSSSSSSSSSSSTSAAEVSSGYICMP